MKIYRYPSPTAEKRLLKIEQRGTAFRRKDIVAVQRILEDVRKQGDDALLKFSRQFDAPKMKLDQLRVTREEMTAAGRQVAPGFKRALNRAARQIEAFHRRQRSNSWIDTPRPGTLLGQMVHPVDVAGVYVPGGQGGSTPLVSTVLMGAIPAKIAGVSEIIMVTPPTRDGAVNPHLLAAAQKAGVTAVFKIGSAWAIGALAYGTPTIPKADVIVGPGNIFVTLAKKLVSGTVQIDMIAGPSEILVVADHTADPEHVAADLLSQAEHDPLASAMLVTDSHDLARSVDKALKQQVSHLDRQDIARQSLEAFGALMVVPDIAKAIELANRIAPEHLELIITEPFSRIGEIRHAGAIFVGPYTPEPVGDYVAGPNHVLPTAGTARFSSALSVDHFIKKTSLIHYAESAFRKEAGDIIRLAETEGLGAHANSVKVRMSRSKTEEP
ncbi:MAG: histidinol dehydrogenase [Desulfobacteraceae bacterium]|jgi:histidinol dehydrogenase